MFSRLLAVASLGIFAAAQQTVQVGAGGGFAFSPTTITAQAGETITFEILSTIHTVTQSDSLTDPCTPAAGGFGTNFGDMSFSLAVNDTTPILVHCEAHCTAGMVMIINPASQNDFTAMSNAAQGISAPSSPSPSSPSSGVSSSSPLESSGAGGSPGPASSSTTVAGSGSPAGSNPPAQTDGTNAAPAGTASPSLLGGLAALFLASIL